MPQKINLTLLSVFLITLLVPLVLVAVLVHVFLHPSFQAELIVGGGTIFIASIAVIGAQQGHGVRLAQLRKHL